MAGVAAHISKLYLVAVGGSTTANDLLPTTECSLDSSAEGLDSTTHGGDGAVERTYGLLDSSFTANVVLKPDDATHARVLALLTGQLAGTYFDAYYQPTGVATLQYKAKVLVTSASFGSPVDGLATVDFTFEATEKLTLTTA